MECARRIVSLHHVRKSEISCVYVMIVLYAARNRVDFSNAHSEAAPNDQKTLCSETTHSDYFVRYIHKFYLRIILDSITRHYNEFLLS